MAKIRIMDDREFTETLNHKLADGKAKLERMRVEFTAARNAYQGIMQKGNGGVDASMVAALMQSQIQSTQDDIMLDSCKLHTMMTQLHSKLCISDPAVTTKPHNRDHANIEAAKMAQLVVEHIRQNTNLKMVLEKGTYLNTAHLGTGVCYVGWNAEGGRLSTQNDPEKIAAMQGDVNGKEIQMEGDYEFRAVSPDDFIIDENSTDFCVDADWCMERRRVPIEKLLWALPEHAEFIQDMAEQMKRDKTEGQDVKEPFHKKERVGALTVWEYWERAQPWNGMGGTYALFVDTGDAQIKLLRRSNNPFDHKDLPFAVLTDLDVEGDQLGLSRAIICLPVQEAINQLYMQVMANIELHGNIRLLCPEGSTPDDIDSNHPATRIMYNSGIGDAPKYLTPTNVTSDIWRLHALLTAEIDQVYASSEFDRGEINRELSSFAVQTAIERSEIKNIRLFNKKKEFIKRLYKQSLANTIQYATESRMLMISGEEESYTKEFFVGADLKGDYGLYVDYGTFLPQDPSARKQQILELVKTGIFEKSGGDMKKLLSILVDGDMFDIKDMFDQAKRIQKEEFTRIINGELAPVQPYHDARAHMEECVSFMQTRFFEGLPEDTKSKIFSHMKEHETALAKLMAAAQPPQGGMPPMGGVPPPAPMG
jgi:hypothetical protein